MGAEGRSSWLLQTERIVSLTVPCMRDGVSSHSDAIAQVVGAATVYWLYTSIAVCRQFDTNGALYGHLPGLYRGWLAGRSMVARHRPHLWPHAIAAFGAAFAGAMRVSAVWMFNAAALALAKAGGPWLANHPWWGPHMTAWGGPVRWDVSINLTLLRCLSYGCDVAWGRQGPSSPPRKPAPCTAAVQAQSPGSVRLPSDDGSLQQQYKALVPLPSQPSLPLYLAYCLCTPLYLTGPIATFNATAAQLLQQCRLEPSWGQVAGYALRLVGCLFLLEAWTHLFYFNAIARFRVWQVAALQGVFSPLQVATGSLWVLVFMWLKFTVLWRMARLGAMVAGIYVPENIRRCVLNNYDVEGFWRGWHCSFNLWLVRYMYIPMGGTRWRALNIWPIFLFVALWHDLQPQLVGWALLTCSLFVPELVVKAAAQQPSVAAWRQRHPWAARQAAGLLATVNIMGLVVVNMVGFVTGADGLALLGQLCSGPGGWWACAAAAMVLHCAALVMFDVRANQRPGLLSIP